MADVRRGQFRTAEGILYFLVVDGIASRAVASEAELDKLLAGDDHGLRTGSVAPTKHLSNIMGYLIAQLVRHTGIVAVVGLEDGFLGVVDGEVQALALVQGRPCIRLDVDGLSSYEPSSGGGIPGFR